MEETRGTEKNYFGHLVTSSIALVLVIYFLYGQNINIFSGNFLWAEDGRIFIQQALDSGLGSLTTSYAGYLHTFPRLAVLLGLTLGLEFIPGIFFFFWTLAFGMMLLAVQRFSLEKTGKLVVALIAGACAALLPNNGEVLFNLTNAQWSLGVLLGIIIFNPQWFSRARLVLRLSVIGTILVMSTTGPFSVLASVAWLCTKLIRGDRLKLSFVTATIFIGAGVQLYFLAQSDRILRSTPLDTDISKWFSAISSLSVFGFTNLLLATVAAAFWLVAFVSLKIAPRAFFDTKLVGLFLYAMLVILSALLLERHNGAAQAIWNMGSSRYSWGPILLLMMISLLLASQHKVTFLIACTLALVILSQPVGKISFADTNYQANVKLGAYRENFVRISPQWGEYPGWGFTPKVSEPAGQLSTHRISQLRRDKETAFALPLTSSGQLWFGFDVPEPCKKAPLLALEVKARLSEENWSTSTLINDGQLLDSLPVWMPKDTATTIYAFDGLEQSSAMEWGLNSKGEVTILDVRITCELIL